MAESIPVYNQRGALVGHMRRDAFPPMLAFDLKSFAIGQPPKIVTVTLSRGEEKRITKVHVRNYADMHSHPAFTIE